MERCGQAHLSKANQKLVKLRTRLNCETETTLCQPSDCPLNHSAFNADVMFRAKRDPRWGDPGLWNEVQERKTFPRPCRECGLWGSSLKHSSCSPQARRFSQTGEAWLLRVSVNRASMSSGKRQIENFSAFCLSVPDYQEIENCFAKPVHNRVFGESSESFKPN